MYSCSEQSLTDKKGGRKTIITPSAAASKRETNFAIDENLSLVGYVVGVKLNGSNILPSNIEEVLDLHSLNIADNSQQLETSDIMIEM